MEESQSYNSEEASAEEEEDETVFIEEESSSESEPEIECDKWDFDSEIVHSKFLVQHLQGYHLMPTCEPEPEPSPRTPKQVKLAAELRSTLTNPGFIDQFKNSYDNREQYLKNDLELLRKPFQVCVVKNFLENEGLLEDVRDEFNDLGWNKRSLDLYEFFQSADLKHVDSKFVRIVYEFIKTEVKDWVASLTGLSLTHTSATCSLYSHSDHLLLHDDQQDDRQVAFVLYLTDRDGWADRYGGALELFDKNQAGQPDKCVREIFPGNNQFVFFQVTNDSYHQVAEVTTKNHCRLSINGWFHTKTPPVFQTPFYAAPPGGLFGNQRLGPKELDLDLESWIKPDYLDAKNIVYMQKYIEDNSEISLHGYFKREAFEGVLESLKYQEVTWKRIGPPNRHNYETIANIPDLPQTLSRFLALFQSLQMFDLLRSYTDLDLATLRWELQRWKPGSYSLLTDYDWNASKELDLVLYLGCTKGEVVGGRMMYVSTEEEVQQALITLEPEENNLNVVFRDTARISKYFSKCSLCEFFYVLVCSYSE